MKCVVLSIFLAVGANAAVVPFIIPCVWSDSDCIFNSAKKAMPYFAEGIKELDIPPIDPVFIKEAIADTGDLKLKIEDLKVVGLGKAEFVKAERDDAKSTLTIVVETPVKATGTYTAGGKLLFIDIEGHGDTELKTDKVRLTVVAKLKKIEKDGKSYYTFDGYDFKYEVLAEFHFRFDNLFNGDKAKADPIIAIIRENWRDLIGQVGGPVIQQIADIVIGAVQKFFESVPVDELELPA